MAFSNRKGAHGRLFGDFRREHIWREKGKERERESMSSSAVEPEAPDLVCQLDNVQGMVDALTAVRWKRLQVGSHPHPLFSSHIFLGTFPWLPSDWFSLRYSGRNRGVVRTRRRFHCGGNRLSSGQSLSSARGTRFQLFLSFSFSFFLLAKQGVSGLALFNFRM